MKYERIEKGYFLERLNRFTVLVEICGERELVHVKNTGRCAELFVPGALVYVQECENANRKTRWDLICVKKGNRLINVDSQIPNYAVKEWIEKGNLCENPSLLRQEVTYGNSRFDLYAEEHDRKIFIEVKGVTLEKEGSVIFPDAPTERGVKHIEELCRAVQNGYEAYIFFVIQMKNVKYFIPNRKTHPEFADALAKAQQQGVKILAYDCEVKKDEIKIRKEVPVLLDPPELLALADPLVKWFRENKRQLPWRENPSAYRVWVSEIMLQQTRVEAVKPFYDRFMKELPTVEKLAEAKEEKLLKLWEGLGYYNRIRNMQKAACQIMQEFDGEFPREYDQIQSLAGIGSYTAGAIASFAYGTPKPAVDGNVLRVVSRILASDEDIMKQSTKMKIEYQLERVIPKDAASDFNQGLIELGAIVCVPNGMAKCSVCPVSHLCRARALGKVMELPVKSKAKERKVEKRTIFIFQDGEKVAIQKRPARGLLAGLYELPGREGHFSEEEAIAFCREIGLSPLRIQSLGSAKHIFSHIEWDMIGYKIKVDELEEKCTEKMLFIHPEEIQEKYPIPAAFEKYTDQIEILLGQEKYKVQEKQ